MKSYTWIGALTNSALNGIPKWQGVPVLLARVSMGVFFAISGGNKLFVSAHHKEMLSTLTDAGIAFPHFMTYFVSGVEFVCGLLLVVGFLSAVCCIALSIAMLVAIVTVQLGTIPSGLSALDWLDDFLYLPEVMYILVFLWLLVSGPGRLSIDHWLWRRLSSGRS